MRSCHSPNRRKDHPARQTRRQDEPRRRFEGRAKTAAEDARPRKIRPRLNQTARNRRRPNPPQVRTHKIRRAVNCRGQRLAQTSTPKSTSENPSARPPAVHRRSAQQQPTPDRYKEIQQALADQGYFARPVDGDWGASSMDALKRFQHDQNLMEDGKVGSVSLIALGLGTEARSASRQSRRTQPAAPPPATEAAARPPSADPRKRHDRRRSQGSQRSRSPRRPAAQRRHSSG